MKAGIPPKDWDEKLKNTHGSFLQSRAWALFQRNLGKETYYCESSDWLFLAIKQKAGGFLPYLYLPYGPLVTNSKGLDQVLNKLKEFGQQRKIAFIRLEPRGYCDGTSSDFTDKDMVKVADIQPSLTNILSLNRSLEEISAHFSSGLKSNLKKASQFSLLLKDEISQFAKQDFFALLNQTTSHQNFVSRSKEYLTKLIEILGQEGLIRLKVVYYEDRPACAAIILDFNQVRYYLHAASDYQINRQTGSSSWLIYNAIKEAKDLGFRSFDFWGVSPREKPSHPWAKLSIFKRAFGGDDLQYSGTWDLRVKRFLYHTYQLLKSIRKR